MYSRASVGAGKVLRLPIRALPSVVVDTERCCGKRMGPLNGDSTESLLRVERCSPLGAPRKPVG